MKEIKKITKKDIDLAILKELNNLNSNMVKKEDIKHLNNKWNYKTIIVSFMGVTGLVSVILGIGLIWNWNNYIIVGCWILIITLFIAMQD